MLGVDLGCSLQLCLLLLPLCLFLFGVSISLSLDVDVVLGQLDLNPLVKSECALCSLSLLFVVLVLVIDLDCLGVAPEGLVLKLGLTIKAILVLPLVAHV